jgi:hypothetical protein
MTGRARLAFLAALAGVVSVSAATADAPTRSPLPLPRGAAEVAAAPVPAPVPPDATANAPRASLRPLARGGAVALSSRDARPADLGRRRRYRAGRRRSTTRHDAPRSRHGQHGPGGAIAPALRPARGPLAERPRIGDAPDARTGDAAGNARDALRYPGAVGRPAGADHGSKRGMRHRRAGAPARCRRHPADHARHDQLRHGAGPSDMGARGAGASRGADRRRGREPARRGLLRLPDAKFPIGRAAQRTCCRQRHRHRGNRSGQWRAS